MTGPMMVRRWGAIRIEEGLKQKFYRGSVGKSSIDDGFSTNLLKLFSR